MRVVSVLPNRARIVRGTWLLAAVSAFLATPTEAATCYAVANAAWNLATTWSNASGGAASTCAGVGGVPGAGDTANIGESATARAVTIPAGYAAQAATVNIGSNTINAKSLTLSAATASLTVSGNLTVTKPSSNTTTNALNVNAGTVTVGGNVTLAGNTGTNSRVSRINVTTGTLTVGGNLVFTAGTNANNYIGMTGGAGTLNLAGAFTTNNVGTLAAGTTSTFNFNGTAAQTIPVGVGAIVYNNLYVNNTSANGATLGNNNITATRVTGDLRVQSGTLNDGGFTITGVAGKTFQVANGATFVYTMNTWVSGFTRTFGATSTVNYARAGGQTVVSESYGHLTLSNSGNKDLPNTAMTIAGNLTTRNTAVARLNADVTVNGNLDIGAGSEYRPQSFTTNLAGNLINSGTFTPGTSTMNFSGTATQTVTGAVPFYNLIIATGATLDAGTSSHQVQGDFTNNGTFSANTGAFTFNGAADQVIFGSLPTTFNDLWLNNTNGSGTELTLNNNTTVNGTLSFLAGNVITGTNTLIIGSTTSCGVTGAGANQHVVGLLRKNFTSTLLSCVYELGDGVNYMPVTVTFDSVSIAGNMTVSMTAGNHPQIGSSGINTLDMVHRYWTFTKGGGLVFGTYSPTFTYLTTDNDTPADSVLYNIKRYKGSWYNVAVSGTPTSTQAVGLGATDDGDFAIGVVGAVGVTREKEYIYTRELYY